MLLLAIRLTTQTAYVEGYQQREYHPSATAMASINAAKDLKLVLFHNPNDTDSNRVVPILNGIFGRLAPKISVQTVQVSFDFSADPLGLVRQFNITQVPTLVILRKDTEVGRIIQKARFSWEDNIVRLIEAARTEREL